MGTLNFGGFMLFQSTPSARRATSKEDSHHDSVEISIHALREEGDAWYCRSFTVI